MRYLILQKNVSIFIYLYKATVSKTFLRSIIAAEKDCLALLHALAAHSLRALPSPQVLQVT